MAEDLEEKRRVLMRLPDARKSYYGAVEDDRAATKELEDAEEKLRAAQKALDDTKSEHEIAVYNKAAANESMVKHGQIIEDIFDTVHKS